MTLQYEDVFSAFLSKITDYEFLKRSDSANRDMMVSWLHSASCEPRLRKKFTALSLDDEDAVLTFTLRNSIDDQSDTFFVKEVLSIAMIIAWVEPQVNTILLTKQMFGGGEEKFFAQANHLAELQNLLTSSETRLSNKLRDYGYYNNSYIRE